MTTAVRTPPRQTASDSQPAELQSGRRHSPQPQPVRAPQQLRVRKFCPPPPPLPAAIGCSITTAEGAGRGRKGPSPLDRASPLPRCISV